MPRDLKAMAGTLTQHLPDGAKITGIRPIAEGYSNETYLVEGLDLILRMPPAGAPLLEIFKVHDVLAQSEILKEWASRAAAPPVPKLHHTEIDPAILGAPFFLMERVDFDPWGNWGLPDWIVETGIDFRMAIADQFIATYSRLHLMAPLTALGPALSIREELSRWAEPVRQIDVPALHEAFAILFDTAPMDAVPAPCHGDAKPVNILWKHGRIVAVIDHEMSFNGDPRFDLGSLLQAFKTVDQAWLPAGDSSGFSDRERLISGWEHRTGRSAADIVWFEAASKARYAAIMAYGDWLAASSAAADERLGGFASTIERLSTSARDLACSHAGMAVASNKENAK